VLGDIIANSSYTMLSSHGVDYLARSEHAGFHGGEDGLQVVGVGLTDADQYQ
jgi:hypothetical protein